MLPIKPASPRPALSEHFREVEVAKDQPKYLPLHTLQGGPDLGYPVITCWEPDAAEVEALMARLAAGEKPRIYIEQLTFGKGISPLRVSVERNLADAYMLQSELGPGGSET